MVLSNKQSRSPITLIFCCLASLLVALSLGACSHSSSETKTGLTMVAERGSETLDIVRAQPGGTKPADIEADSWTVFVYLCGSDLESNGGAATTDLGEMVGAIGSDNVKFVVETGGASEWESSSVDSNRTGRYLIQDGSIMDVGSTALKDMGEADTLSEFLTWGIQNYPAEHMGVILWDHGGGPISGVCFDEQYDDNALVLREIDQALATTFEGMWDKFEFIGFDACLMSNIETANVLATYANYMIASEEEEPGDGWEYSSIVEFLANNPTASGADLGKTICDTYQELNKSENYITLSVTDLSKVDNLLQAFNRFSQELYSISEDTDNLKEVVHTIREVENFGPNNWLEGYTNIIDLGGLAEACSSATPSSQDVIDALNEAVSYKVANKRHKNASGLSVYYPLSTGDSEELKLFQAVSVNPSYIAFVDHLTQNATYGEEEYDDGSLDTLYTDDSWNWLVEDESSEEYWDYVDEHDAESTLITFTHKPQIDEDGFYWFQLDKEGLENTATVSALVSELTYDGDLVSLGETFDVDADWDTGIFYDAFDGYWLSLPDGQNLCLYIADWTDNYIVYTSPVELNGEERYLHIRQYYESGKTVVEGVYDGLSEEGQLGRGTTELKKGDVIVPLFDAFTIDSEEELTYVGEEYRLESNKLTLDYQPLYAGTYFYSFCIEDIYGDYLTTDAIELEVEENGDIYFYE